MFGPRMLMGAAIGAALVYFLDPQNGARRRQQVRDWWEQNREPMMNKATAAQSKVSETTSQIGEKVGEKVSDLQSRVRNTPTPVP